MLVSSAGAVGRWRGGRVGAGTVIDGCGSRSSRFSMGAVFPSECSPTGFKGRRKVPLLGRGLIRSESHIILYTSMFSGQPLAR